MHFLNNIYGVINLYLGGNAAILQLCDTVLQRVLGNVTLIWSCSFAQTMMTSKPGINRMILAPKPVIPAQRNPQRNTHCAL
jgi:hypothetical protein